MQSQVQVLNYACTECMFVSDIVVIMMTTPIIAASAKVMNDHASMHNNKS